MKPRIMYIEQKTGDQAQAFIGRVTFSKSGKTIYYRDKAFRALGNVYGNYRGYDKEEYIANQNLKQQKHLAYDCYWISGPKKDGSDRLFGHTPVIQIDEDVREEYWTTIRDLPEFIAKESY